MKFIPTANIFAVLILLKLMTVTGTSAPNPSVSPNDNDMNWFAGIAEEELLYYTSNDVDSLWAVIGSFVPPPPRPPYLPEDGIVTDGLTTCDLCTWALRNDRHLSFSLDGTLEAPGEFGWVLTLIIVSLISAAIGAVVMVTLLHCRRIKSAGGRASCCGVGVNETNAQEAVVSGGGGVAGGGGVSVIPDRPPLELDKLPPYHDVTPSPGHNVWSWLGSRRGGGAAGVVTTPLSLPQHRCPVNLPVENHYTHMQTDEALYAELDSQTASYASDLQLQLRGSSTYGDGGTTPGEEDEYHELDAARLHKRYGSTSDNETLKRDSIKTRHNQRLKEPDYEMYENGPSTPVPPSHLTNHNHNHHHHHPSPPPPSHPPPPPSHHHHHLHHHHHHIENHRNNRSASDVNPSYQNTGYTGSDNEPDGPFLSSAPSSAYYSDLSSNSAIQQSNLPVSTAPVNQEQPQYRLAAINETTTPSDYI